MFLTKVKIEKSKWRENSWKLSNHVGHFGRLRNWKQMKLQSSNLKIFIFSTCNGALTFRLHRSRCRHLFSLWWLFTFSLTLKVETWEKRLLVASIIPKKKLLEYRCKEENLEIEIYFQPHREDVFRFQSIRFEIGAMIIEKFLLLSDVRLEVKSHEVGENQHCTRC